MLNYLSGRKMAAVGLLLVGIVLGCCFGVALSVSSTAIAAEVRRGPPREAFKSGGERAVVVLEGMAESLKRIEKRLESIEKTIAGLKADDPN